RGIGVRLGEPLLPDTTHDLVALEGAGVRGADFASQSGAVADLQACAGATEVGHRLAGAGAGDFRRKLQATRRAVDGIEASRQKEAKEMKPAEASLPSDTEVLVKRSFDAPVELVWRAYMEPGLLRRWCSGTPGWSMPVCEMDMRVGGKYRWRWRNDENGQEFGFTGEVLEVDQHAK